MLEHVENPPALMHTLADLLLPNGILLLSTINRHPKAFLQAIVAAEFILNLLPKGTHHYAQFIRPSELIHAAKNAQLTLQDLKGISYQPLRNTFSLTENLQVNYLACFKKPPQ